MTYVNKNSQVYAFESKWDLTYDDRIDALLNGTKWGGAVGEGATITFSYPQYDGYVSPDRWFGYQDSQSRYDDPDEPFRDGFNGFTFKKQDEFERALQAWEEVAQLNFQWIPDSDYNQGVIRIAFTTNADSGIAKNADGWVSRLRRSYNDDDQVQSNGDIWVNSTRLQDANLEPGSYGFYVMLHEIGHALGLKHPFKDANYTDGEAILGKDLDNNKYTVMAYNRHPDSEWLLPATPMPFDILAIQYLYGVNTMTRSDSTNYIFSYGENVDNANDAYIVDLESGFRTIWDAGGLNDVFDVSKVPYRAVLDLRAGAFSSIGNHVDNIAIAYNVDIEHAIGGYSDDKIVGNSKANNLRGMRGDDTIMGGAGADTLDGGSGSDTVDYSDGERTVAFAPYFFTGAEWSLSLDLDKGKAFLSQTVLTDGGYLSRGYYEKVVNFENAIGTAGADTIFGSDDNNIIQGGGGRDFLDGRDGNDTVDYSDSDRALVLDLHDGMARLINNDYVDAGLYKYAHSDVYGETVLNFENAIGTAGADTIFGSDDNNKIQGGGGRDFLDGRDGNDTVDYSDSDRALVLDLHGGKAWLINNDYVDAGLYKYAHSDVYSETVLNFENAIGTKSADRIYGTDERNKLVGGSGGDRLYGKGGDDVLSGGPGNDILDGGTDIDTVDYRYSEGILEVDLAEEKGAIIANPKSDGDWLPADDTDVLVNIEKVIGSLGPSNIYGNDAANYLDGFAGRNTIYGRGGNDTLWGGNDDRNWLYGGENDDTLYGGDDDDWLDGGAGADFMQGFDGDDVYVVDRLDDKVNEFQNEGADTVRTAAASYVLPANVENLQLLGSAWLDGSGNDLDNLIMGNGAPNSLFGHNGDDMIDGGGGADKLVGGAGKDVLTGGAGADRFVFNGPESSGFGPSDADVITDFKWWEGDKIDLLAPDIATSFVGWDAWPDLNEVGYWWDDKDTIISFNREGDISNIVLADLNLRMIESDFIL